MEQGAITDNQLMRALGRGFSRPSVCASASLAVLSLFYVYTVGSFAKVITYSLIDRVTYESRFEYFVVNEYVDHLIIGSLFLFWLFTSLRKSTARYAALGVLSLIFVTAAATVNDQALYAISLAALPAIITLVLLDRYPSVIRKKILASKSDLVPNYLAIIGIALGIIALIYSISAVIYSSIETPIRNYAYDIFLLLSRFSPILMLVLIACYPVKILYDIVTSNLRSQQEDRLTSKGLEGKISNKRKIGFLSLFVILAVMIALIPHLPTVNRDNQLVGVDTRQYAAWMGTLAEADDPQNFLNQVFIKHSSGDRPLSLLIIFGFQQLIPAPNDDVAHSIEYLPFVLSPGLVLAVYFTTRQLTLSDSASLFAAFLTSISYQVLIGLYAGFFANWIALIFGFLSIGFLFRFLRSNNSWNLVTYGILATITLFSHVYTWSILAIVSGAFLAAIIKFNSRLIHGETDKIEDHDTRKGRKHRAILLFIALACTVAIDIGRTGLTGASSGIEGDLEIGERLAGLEQFTLRWNNLTHATMVYVGGLFANFLILGLGIYWLLRSHLWKMQTIFIVIFFSVGIIPFLFGEWIIQTRVFYNIPFQIPAAFALMYIRQRSGGLLRSVPIYIWLITFSIFAVSNFYLILPS